MKREKWIGQLSKNRHGGGKIRLRVEEPKLCILNVLLRKCDYAMRQSI